jgi:hypothetical protein
MISRQASSQKWGASFFGKSSRSFAARVPVAGALRQFPQLSGINTISPYAAPLGFSHYHSLQITLDRQLRKGLTIYANYVWSKVLSNTESSFLGDNAGPLDYYNLRLEKAPASFDLPHMIKAYFQWDIPVGKGRALPLPHRVLDAVLGGWSLSGILNYYSGGPLGFGGASNPMPNGWNGGQRPNVAAGPMKNASFDSSRFNFRQHRGAGEHLRKQSAVLGPASSDAGQCRCPLRADSRLPDAQRGFRPAQELSLAGALALPDPGRVPQRVQSPHAGRHQHRRQKPLVRASDQR